MAKNILNIKQYFEQGMFVIPNYQRGYKWGVPDEEGNCAVSVLMDNLIDSFINEPSSEYFIQGVTVYEDGSNIVLIDGQQRTTTFFLLLKYLNYDFLSRIAYDIRKESAYVLNNSTIENGELKFVHENGKDYDLQDIFYFKKAIKTIHCNLNSDKAKNLNKSDLKKFILEKIKLFYITIAKDKATKVFTMVNGQKAFMKPDELIKAALLSKASQAINIDVSESYRSKNLAWEMNTLRNKYAREWDKWLYWWNREEVKNFFDSGNNPLGLLLEYYFEINKADSGKSYSYKNFNELFFKEPKDAKYHFKKIRNFQKTFEDWYNNPHKYNYIGLILKAVGRDDKKEALLYLLMNSKNEIFIQDYAKWRLVGATHRDIIEIEESKKGEITKELQAEKIYGLLCEPYVYWDESDADFKDGRKEMAFRQLLRMNVQMDDELHRKFDFKIYNKRSLEHIQPKSKGLKISEEYKRNISVHCIGNLVLLSGPDNSSFKDKDFLEKKKVFFDPNNVRESMSFLHSLTVFSQSEWTEKEIDANKTNFKNNYRATYNIINAPETK